MEPHAASPAAVRVPRAVWLVAAAAGVLALAAFVLWGTRGAAYIVDMIAAVCL